MYKLLLCWRYLRTRYIALASIISVTLGVATMIVVNSVMAGFTQRDAGPHPRHPLRRGVRIAQPRRLATTPTGTWSRSAQVAGDDDRGHDAHGRRAGHAQLSVQRQLDHAAGAVDRHRRADAEPGERFRQVSAASGEPRADELRAARRRLRRARSSGRRPTPPRERWPSAGWKHRRDRIGRSERGSSAKRHAAKPPAEPRRLAAADRRCRQRPPAESPQPRRRSRSAGDPFPASRTQASRSIRPRSSTPAWCWASPWPASASRDGEDRFLVLPGDDVQADLSHRRPRRRRSVSDIVHDRRFLRKQDERIRLRASSSCRSSKLQELRGMIDPTTGIGYVNAHPDQAQAGRRRRRGARQAAGGVSRRSSTASRPGATSKARCWPPCRWRRPSSTCCCS